MSTVPDFASAAEAAQAIDDGQGPIEIAVVLGSGLGAFADQIENAQATPYDQIPHFARSTVAGHAGQLVRGTLAGKRLGVFQGRFHYYEGWSPQQLVLPVRLARALGAKTLIVTNAAGSVNPAHGPGKLMLIRDHINALGFNPLRGANDDAHGPRFPPMSVAYTPRLRTIARCEAAAQGIDLLEGVYAATFGPSYETPAEVAAFGRSGADAVGMSTVPEVIAAVHMGMEVLGVSCLTNWAAGLSAVAPTHDEVIETGASVAAQFVRLLTGVIGRIDEPGEPAAQRTDEVTQTDAAAERVIAAALAARERTYSPYSKFAVGAAVEDDAGRIFGGCNVENVSYGLTCCAERVALFKARSEGAGAIRQVAVVAETDGPPFPCGACRQVIAELAPGATVWLRSTSGATTRRQVADLLPDAFTSFERSSDGQ